MYVTVLPETGKIADGIKRALLAVDQDVRKAAQRWKEEIERELEKVKVDVTVKVDPQKAKKEIEAAAKDQTATITADAETGSAETQLGITARPRKAKIIAEVDEPSVAKAGAKISANLQKAGGTGKGFFGKGGGVNLPFRATIPFPVAIEAIGIAPNVVPLIGSMAQSVGALSGAFALLPATIGAAGLAFGSLKIGMSGFADAIKEIGDPEKFAEAIKQLSPAAQGAATAIQGLMPQVTQLKMTVQDALFTGMGEQFTKLGNTYLPIFQQVMGQMALSANKALAGISEMLQTPEMQSDIKTFGANASRAFNILVDAAQPFVKALSDIMVVGSSFLPQLADTVRELADRFARFIEGARESGRLAEWIQNGITAFTQLKDIAVNVWDIFKGIFEAAGGGDFLQTVSDLTEKWSEWINSIQGQNALKDFFADAKQTLQEVWPIVRDLGIALFNAFQGAKDVIDQILPLLQQIASYLAQHKELAYLIGAGIGTWKLVGIISSLATIAGKFSGISGQIAGLPGQATTAAGGIRAAFANLTLPTLTLTIIADIAYSTGQQPGGPNSLSANAQRGDWWATVIGPTLSNVLGNAAQPNPTPPAINPITGKVYGPGENRPNPPAPAPIQQLPRDSYRTRTGEARPLPAPAPAPLAPNQPYQPPLPSSGSGGGGGGAAPEPVPPGGMSYDYTGYGELNWDALAELESGGNPHALSKGGTYKGLYQFDDATWASVGGTQFAPTADQASEDEQTKCATALYNSRGTAPWPANGWVLTANEEQLKAAGLTSTGRRRSNAGRGGAGGNRGTYGQGPGFQPQPYGLPGGTNTGGYSSGIPQSPWATQLGAQFGVTPSTYGGHQESNRSESGFAPNPQNLNRGIDWTGSPAQMRQMAEYLMQNPSFVEQLIYEDPETGKRYGLAGGRDVSSTGYYSAQWAGHRGHLHTRQSQTFPGPQDQMGQYSYDGPGGDRNDPMYVQSAKDTGGAQLGKDIVSGVMEIFGFGDLFKDPTQFGAFKIGKSLISAFTSGAGGLDNGSGYGSGGHDPMSALQGGGTGNPLIDMMAQFIPGGTGNSIAEDIAAWQPAGGSTGGLSGFSAPGQFGDPNLQGGNIDNSRHMVVQGNVDPVVWNEVDTKLLSDTRNLPKK